MLFCTRMQGKCATDIFWHSSTWFRVRVRYALSLVDAVDDDDDDGDDVYIWIITT